MNDATPRNVIDYEITSLIRDKIIPLVELQPKDLLSALSGATLLVFVIIPIVLSIVIFGILLFASFIVGIFLLKMVVSIVSLFVD